jgi:hypothetical protein
MTDLIFGAVLGLIFGTALGFHFAFRALTIDRVISLVGARIAAEHRAYRSALAHLAGSTDEADRLMSVYREEENL